MAIAELTARSAVVRHWPGLSKPGEAGVLLPVQIGSTIKLGRVHADGHRLSTVLGSVARVRGRSDGDELAGDHGSHPAQDRDHLAQDRRLIAVDGE